MTGDIAYEYVKFQDENEYSMSYFIVCVSSVEIYGSYEARTINGDANNCFFLYGVCSESTDVESECIHIMYRLRDHPCYIERNMFTNREIIVVSRNLDLGDKLMSYFRKNKNAFMRMETVFDEGVRVKRTWYPVVDGQEYIYRKNGPAIVEYNEPSGN